MSRTRKALLGTTLVLYALIVLAVLMRTDLVRIDWQLFLFRPYKQWPELHAFLDYFVTLGQRGPTAVLVMAWLGWRSWRQRTLRPLLVLGTSLLLLNATVGAVKIGLGRLGPHYATSIGSAELFQGGDIFPSGHTANAVVTWGILAYLATTPRARRVLSVVAASFALTIGATTVYLGTHWASDVVLGWAAGLLVLLALPWCEPAIARVEALIFALRARLRAAGQRGRGLAPAPVSAAAANSAGSGSVLAQRSAPPSRPGPVGHSSQGGQTTQHVSGTQAGHSTATKQSPHTAQAGHSTQATQESATSDSSGLPGARPSGTAPASSGAGGSAGGSAARLQTSAARQYPQSPLRAERAAPVSPAPQTAGGRYGHSAHPGPYGAPLGRYGPHGRPGGSV